MWTVGRLSGIVLIILILMVTPFAFWVFNLERVALNPQTYRNALRSQNVYNDLLPALVDGAAADNNMSVDHKQALRSLVNNMTADDWAAVSDKLLPPAWLQKQLEGNIGRFFDWIDGNRATTGITFDLTELKSKLSGTSAEQAAQIIVPKLPACTADQVKILKNAATGQDVGDTFPACNASAAGLQPGLQQVEIAGLTTFLKDVGNSLPDRWDLSEQLRKAELGPRGQRITDFDLSRFRAFIWFQSRISIALFLIPLALLSLIVLVAIRSAKQFFRWLGWVLIACGLITLLPVPFVPGTLVGSFGGPHTSMQEGFGDNARLLESLVSGMVSSIASGLTLAVLIQVAIVIAIGFAAVALSVVLASPEPDVSRQDVLREQSQLAQAQPGSGSDLVPASGPSTNFHQ